MYIKHSKFKNTGILFEILVKKITGDTLSGRNSPAIKIIKEYFVNTELGKEYKLYETIFKNKRLTEQKANVVLTTVLEQSKKLNRTKLKNEKYNLIKELKSHYDVEDLFKTKLSDYKVQASFYTLLEIYNTKKSTDSNQIVDNKICILESITNHEVNKVKVKDVVLEEFKSYYLLFDNGPLLKEFYNKEITNIKLLLEREIKKVKDQTTKIKLKEVNKLILELNKRTTVKNNHLVDLLQYHSLLEELTGANG